MLKLSQNSNVEDYYNLTKTESEFLEAQNTDISFGQLVISTQMLYNVTAENSLKPDDIEVIKTFYDKLYNYSYGELHHAILLNFQGKEWEKVQIFGKFSLDFISNVIIKYREYRNLLNLSLAKKKKEPTAIESKPDIKKSVETLKNHVLEKLKNSDGNLNPFVRYLQPFVFDYYAENEGFELNCTGKRGGRF